MSPFETIRAQALALSPVERAALIDDLMGSLEPETRTAVDCAWADEAEARVAAVEAGQLEVIPFEEVQRRVNLG